LPEEEDEKKKMKKLKKMYQPLTEWWRKTLDKFLDTVAVSQRLTDDPCVIVATESGYSPNMERISKAQAYSNPDKSSPYLGAKKILEINPHHPVIKELLDRVKESPDAETEELATLLFETALINSGYSLASPTEYAKKFYKLFNGALGLPKDAKVEEIEVNLDDDEDEKKDEKKSDDSEEVKLDDEKKDDEPEKSKHGDEL